MCKKVHNGKQLNGASQQVPNQGAAAGYLTQVDTGIITNIQGSRFTS